MSGELKADAVLIDSGEGTALFTLAMNAQKTSWYLISFAGQPNDTPEAKDSQYANIRAQMYYESNSWLQKGGALDSRNPEWVGDIERQLCWTKGGRHKVTQKKSVSRSSTLKLVSDNRPTSLTASFFLELCPSWSDCPRMTCQWVRTGFKLANSHIGCLTTKTPTTTSRLSMSTYTTDLTDTIDPALAAFYLEEAPRVSVLFKGALDWSNFDVAGYAREHLLWVCRIDNEPTGVLMARLYSSIFDRTRKILFQDLLYVKGARSRVAHDLLQHYIDFGKSNADHIFTAITPVTNIKGRSLERLGFNKIQEMYRLEVSRE